MPKLVDHAARRLEIVRVHQQQVAEHGFGATTYARLATAAGVSVGTVQHYFTDRAELVRCSFEQLLADRDARVAAVVSHGEAVGRSIREMVTSALHELLPLDVTRRREHSVGQQLRAEAWREATLRDLAVVADERLLVRLAEAVRNGTECGEVDAEIDERVAATRILATAAGLADGLWLARPTGPDLTHRLDDVLAPVVATVFTGICRRR